MKTKIQSIEPLVTARVENTATVPDVTGLEPPMVLMRSGQELIRLYNAFLHLSIKSDDTRSTYRSALTQFFRFCDNLDLQELVDIEPEHVRTYLDHRTKTLQMMASAPNHYHAIKSLFQYLIDSGPLTSNPAASVNYAFVRSRKGKTAVITKSDVRELLISIPSDPEDETEPAKQTDLRDRALIALMAYTFARIGGALSTNVGDYKMNDGVMWLNMIEKGSKSHSVPISGAAQEYINTYIEYCGLTDPKTPLFQSANRTGHLTGKRYDRGNSRRMIARRAEALGIGKGVKNHTFRATGITRFLEDGGKLDDAQDIANHSDSSTTRRYDRRSSKRLIHVMKNIDY
ncbi:MAG: tyrosine-type recombinase/integrase [Maricaulaceae bacterium]